MEELVKFVLFGAPGCLGAWAAVAGLVLSALGTAASGIGSAVGNNRQQQQLNNEKARQEAWYNTEMYQDPLKRSDNAAMLRLIEDRIKEQERTDAARQKVLGGTTEARLANRDSNNKAYAGVVSNMASLASKRMDSLSAQKNQALSGFAQQQMGIDNARMQNWANLANNAAKLGEAALSGIDKDGGNGGGNGGGDGGGDGNTGDVSNETKTRVELSNRNSLNKLPY